MKTIPNNVQKYSETPSFTVNSVPKGLLKDHSTKAGVWGRLLIESGRLEYTITDPDEPEVHKLCQGEEAVIAPQQLHFVKLLTEDTIFRVEFLK